MFLNEKGAKAFLHQACKLCGANWNIFWIPVWGTAKAASGPDYISFLCSGYSLSPTGFAFDCNTSRGWALLRTLSSADTQRSAHKYQVREYLVEKYTEVSIIWLVERKIRAAFSYPVLVTLLTEPSGRQTAMIAALFSQRNTHQCVWSLSYCQVTVFQKKTRRWTDYQIINLCCFRLDIVLWRH